MNLHGGSMRRVIIMAGNIEKRGKNTYRLTVSGGVDSEGKRIKYRKNIKASSKREAEKELAKFVSEVENGQFADPGNLTFADFVQVWKKEYAEKQLAPKTFKRYRVILEHRVLPAIGHMKIAKIRPTDIIKLINEIENSPRMDGKPGKLSAQTVKHHYRCVSAILQDAVEWQIIPYNPASRVKPPKVERKQVACYDEHQAYKLIKALEKAELKYRLLILLAITTGMREGENNGTGMETC